MNPYGTSCSRALAVAAVTVFAVVASAIPATAQAKYSTPIDLVRNVDEPGFNVYQHSQTILFTTVSGTAIFDLPAGKVVVVEHISTSGALQTGGIVQAFVRCSTTADATEETNHSLVLFSEGTVNGLTQYSASQPLKCFAASPGSLSIHVQTSTINSAQHTWVMAVSGHTVPQ